MSYLVLARKYRPKTFTEVVGQDVVTRTLRGAIEENRIGHAYLFTGPRGTGKTTSARLFAKALNCESGPTPDPCGTCERCIASDTGTEIDILEIDAASNTGVDHVRDLRDQASYVPLRARFKIYIVDEVHMLSKAAFNALLKTLEEPPPHVKFLFATTELHKVLDTILSRCQVLKLAPIAEGTITARLDEVFRQEGVEAEEGVTRELARRARGGMRDALSLADQLLALVGSKPKREDVERLASEGSPERIEAIVGYALAGERAELLRELPTTEGDETELLSGVLDHLRACLLAALCGADAPMLDVHPGATDERAKLAERGKAIGVGRLELWLAELLAARERMRLLPSHARVILEVALLDLARPETTVGLSEIAERLLALEGRLPERSGDVPRPPRPVRSPAPDAASPPPVERSDPPPSDPPPSERRVAPAPKRPESADTRKTERSGPRVRTNSTADAWSGFLAELAGKAPSLADLLDRKGTLVQYGGERAVVKLSKLGDGERALIEDERNRKSCTSAFTEAVGRTVEVQFQDTSRARPGSEDPFTSQVAELFDGRIEE